ncbi:MAG: cysteine--tRNA ligase [Dehalococcoidia bacterium]|nr:cysteine--tRNA ligase [Dehalococcoidia bacterium]
MKVWNTLTGQKAEFVPEHDPVRMYVCGVTPYSESHIGHAMSSIVFDMIRRYLEFSGYRVKYVQNFTDVDDKIINRANQQKVDPVALAESYVQQYLSDMDALNVKRADAYPRVTTEIPQIVAMIQTLIDKGYAYPSGGDVYYRVERFAEYGKLSHRTLDGMMAGARIEVDEQKEHPMDFALWKGAKPGEPAWPSPWGPGRPGWHIECSAMSVEHLGEQVDIHGGGQDLEFPHHENEVAQSEAATGKVPFAKYWMHNGLLRLGEEKMSKSLGNLVTIGDALSRHTGDALRMLVLASNYRSPLTYTEEALEGAERGAERLMEALRPSEPKPGAVKIDDSGARAKFSEAMDDDFNTAQAIAGMFDLAREINRGREAGADVSGVQATLQELAGVLGLKLQAAESVAIAAAPFIALLIELRADLRVAKNFAGADKVRNRLTELGITLEDSAQGTTWKAAR